MSIWQSIISALGGTAILVAAATWLAKSIITHFLTKDIEGHKRQLESQHNAALERQRADLERLALEHEVKFSRLHDKRAEAIEVLYEKLVSATDAVQSYLAPYQLAGEPDKSTKYKTAMTAIIEFFEYFDKKRIYLDEPLCERIESFVHSIRSPTIEYSVYADQETNDPKLLKEKRDIMIKAWKSVRADVVPQARKALEHEFRILLGAIKTDGSPNKRVEGTLTR